MRNLLLVMMLSVAAMFTSCDNGGDDPTTQSSITGYDETELNQTIFADETSTSGDFTFTAAEAWYTVIEPKVKSGEVDNWVTLDPASGNAGTVNMSINLGTNTTGEERSATIKIVCGETTITITIEQKATTESGEKLAGERLVEFNFVNLIQSEYSYVATLEYDDNDRITRTDMTGDINEIGISYSTFVYDGDKVKLESFYNGGKQLSHNFVMTQNSNGYIIEVDADFNWREEMTGVEKEIYSYTNNQLTAINSTYTNFYNFDSNGDGVIDDRDHTDDSEEITLTWTEDNITRYNHRRSVYDSEETENYTYSDIKNNKYIDLNSVILSVIDAGADYTLAIFAQKFKGISSANLMNTYVDSGQREARFEYTLNDKTSLPEKIDIYYVDTEEITTETKIGELTLKYE